MLLERCSALGFAEPSDCTAAPLACMGGCSGAGECVAGFCKCRPGHFGADCSLSLGRDGKPQLLAGRGYTPRSRGPRVYMYELPPEFTTWRNEAHLDRPTTHHFIERLTATGAR
ncbi:hypothetical protein HYH03_007795 [Edaphochlamys debaryana]|nr:hypothetical protein HYH03_007794 [Edaphochlamys debaryana]KAG2494160.1 hypothetical protein HYH03_007795 [Edaphochlamys debaryana]|eukprot:KAG2494159.1 hypothetical protein HYH03_007794 [Edaphochlamys debaryana]